MGVVAQARKRIGIPWRCATRGIPTWPWIWLALAAPAGSTGPSCPLAFGRGEEVPYPPAIVFADRSRTPFGLGCFEPCMLSHPLPFVPHPEHRAHFWVVRTAQCPQVMGTDPWPDLRIHRLAGPGTLVPCPPSPLLARAADRPLIVVVNGNLVAGDRAIRSGLWAQFLLDRYHALMPGSEVVVFDWPSERVLPNVLRDLDEKQRRAYVAGYHLARFLEALPPGSRVCLIGHSSGGRAITSALHLLGGGHLDTQEGDPPVRLPFLRPDLRLRAVLIENAIDHHWLYPGERLDAVLPACQAFFNLHNRSDPILRLYPFQARTQHRPALGVRGVRCPDRRCLGPFASRYDERDLRPLLGSIHSLVLVLANPEIAHTIGRYTWANQP